MGERVRVRGPPSDIGPLTPALSPAVESVGEVMSLAGEREEDVVTGVCAMLGPGADAARLA